MLLLTTLTQLHTNNIEHYSMCVQIFEVNLLLWFVYSIFVFIQISFDMLKVLYFVYM